MLIGRQVLWSHGRIELIGFILAEGEDPVEIIEGIVCIEIGFGKTHSDYGRFSRTKGEFVMSCRLGARMFGINGIFATMHDVVIDAVLDIWGAVREPTETLIIGLVLRKQQFRTACAIKPATDKLGLIQFDDRVRTRTRTTQLWAEFALSPRPGIAEPDGRQNAEIRAFRTTIRDCDPDENVLGIGLCVFYEYIEVAVLVEHACIEQFVLRLKSVSAPVFF